jgi:hypothetical protein
MKAPIVNDLVSTRRGLHETPPAISGTALPSDASVVCDRLKMVIALRRADPADNGCCPRWDGHARGGVPLPNFFINRPGARARPHQHKLPNMCHKQMRGMTEGWPCVAYIRSKYKEGRLLSCH